MTTIVYRDGVLAVDSQVTMSSGKVVSKTYNKIRHPEGCMFNNQLVEAYALAGDAASYLVLERLMVEEGGLLPGDNLESEDDFEAIVVCETNVYLLEKSSDKPAVRAIELDSMGGWAIGSGASVASHVLSKGYDAEGAVFEAMLTDVFSGGAVKTWTKEKKK